jgi:hypothetical protein
LVPQAKIEQHEESSDFLFEVCRLFPGTLYNLSNGQNFRTGRYEIVNMSRNIPVTQVSYEQLEHRFDKMSRQHYHTLWYNCGHWAKSFYVRLLDEKFIRAPPFGSTKTTILVWTASGLSAEL